MARVSTYINTQGRTEEAFEFYSQVFRSPISFRQRFSEFPEMANSLPEYERDGIMHIELSILDGHILMGTDMLESAGHEIRIGNNTTINLEPDNKDDADRFYNLLSQESTEHSNGMSDMDWGAYWGCCLDKFGIRWMINFAKK
jgi:PhnB protein